MTRLSTAHTKFIPANFGFFNKIIKPSESCQFIEFGKNHFVQVFEDNTVFYFQRTIEGDYIGSNKPFNLTCTAIENDNQLAIQIDWNERTLQD